MSSTDARIRKARQGTQPKLPGIEPEPSKPQEDWFTRKHRILKQRDAAHHYKSATGPGR